MIKLDSGMVSSWKISVESLLDGFIWCHVCYKAVDKIALAVCIFCKNAHFLCRNAKVFGNFTNAPIWSKFSRSQESDVSHCNLLRVRKITTKSIVLHLISYFSLLNHIIAIYMYFFFQHCWTLFVNYRISFHQSGMVIVVATFRHNI